MMCLILRIEDIIIGVHLSVSVLQSLPQYTHNSKLLKSSAYSSHQNSTAFITPKISTEAHCLTKHSNLPHLAARSKQTLNKSSQGQSPWIQRPILSRQHTHITSQHMTVGAKTGTSKPRSNMDFLSGDYLNGPIYDHRVSGDIDSAIFASSPNSLCIYEQEKNDMQSFNDTSCNGSMTSLLNEEQFDLKSQYENSLDITMPVGTSAVTTTSGTFSENTWVNNSESQTCNTDLVKTEVFEPTLAELNTSTSEENTMMDISNITDYISQESMQQLDLLLSAAQQSFSNVENSGTRSETKQNSRDRGRHSSASEVSQTWTATLPSQEKDSAVLSGDVKLPNYQQRPLQGARVRHSSASSYSSKPPQKSTAPSTTLQQLLSVRLPSVAVTNTEHTVPTSTPPQLSPGKRKRSSIPEEESSSSVDRKWEEIKQLLYPEEKQVPSQPKCTRQSLDSVGSAPSFDDSDSDSDVNDFSDSDSEGSQEEWTAGRSSRESRQVRKDQFFWQYNIQSKGPKGKRVRFGMDENPHKVQDFEDPVFDSSSASQLGTTIRHGGKARKGDGNDVSPNPKKLVQIGCQIKKLNKQINSFAPLSELPVSTRNKSKKEKNKLASRACRLKKKAQHEANKVKLHGLDIEHKQLLGVIDTIKEDLHNFIIKKGPQLKFSTRLESLIKEKLTLQVAGNTTDYVNSVISKVEAGDPKGGLYTKKFSVKNDHT
ncbi:uncharacterized protein LOC133194378 [Saccostrea echinata]|uniref:uncharacterized protein LOC133194378 n=1 Tax=Saccostrea echinata TaxID=191078 RepID=UPI002A8302F4|nr:uncharacterized protein LOC133194378 [Saccostrea echinata]